MSIKHHGQTLKGIIVWCSLVWSSPAFAHLQHSLWWCFQKSRLTHANRSPLCYFNEVYAVQGGAGPQPGGKKTTWRLSMTPLESCGKKSFVRDMRYSSTAMQWKRQRHWHDQASLRHKLPKLAIDASASFPHHGKMQMMECQITNRAKGSRP